MAKCLISRDTRRYQETGRATSYFDARRLIEDRYRRCVIWDMRESWLRHQLMQVHHESPSGIRHHAQAAMAWNGR